jgi:hypothetical protein
LFESQPVLLRRVAEAMIPLLPTDTQLLGGLKLPCSRTTSSAPAELQSPTGGPKSATTAGTRSLDDTQSSAVSDPRPGKNGRRMPFYQVFC